MGNYLHSTTEKRIKAMTATEFQPILLQGPLGVDIDSAVKAIATIYSANVLQASEQAFSSVEEVRELYELTKTVPADVQIVVITHAETLSPAAQNALLKLLEEPPKGYIFVLTSSSVDSLLPTVLSRVRIIEVLPITEQQSDDLLNELGVMDATTRQQILFIASGLPEKIKQLATNSSYFDKEVNLIKDARSLLQSRTYNSLLIIDRYKNDRDTAIDLVLYCAKLLIQTLKRTPTEHITHKLEQYTQAHENLIKNANVRTALMRLVV